MKKVMSLTDEESEYLVAVLESLTETKPESEAKYMALGDQVMAWARTLSPVELDTATIHDVIEELNRWTTRDADAELLRMRLCEELLSDDGSTLA